MNQQEQVIKRIKSLFAMATNAGASENEKAKAILHAQKLMRKHQLTETDVQEGKSNEPESFGDLTYRLPAYGRSIMWMRQLITAIADHNFVRCYYKTSGKRGTQTKTVELFGTEQDIRLTIHAFEGIRQQITIQCDIDYHVVGGNKAKFRNSFCIGAVSGFVTVLGEMADKADAESNTTALVIAKDAQLDAAFYEHVPLLVTKRSRSQLDLDAYYDGQGYGSSLSVNPAIATKDNRTALPG